MNKRKIYRSPLFYVGDKYKILYEIREYFPLKINKFIEPFVGGGSVFLNVKAQKYLLNDIDSNIIKLHKFLLEQSENPINFFLEIFKKIKKYGLSYSYLDDVVPKKMKKNHIKTYYAVFNKKGFNRLKTDYNSAEEKDMMDLYLLLIYGFNRILRFNSKGEFNLPVGNVDFNRNVYLSLVNYFSIVNKKDISFFNMDFFEFVKQINFEKDDFIYFDPPYLITNSEYNKLWTQKEEERLIELLEYIDYKKIKFAVSNITKYKGKTNTLFREWAKKYNIYNIKSNYISYHDNSIKSINEVLVTNYESKTAFNLKKENYLTRKDLFYEKI